jgi:hypothetical protein
MAVAKTRERLAANKRRPHRFHHMEVFNVKKLNELVGKENDLRFSRRNIPEDGIRLK